MAFSISSSSKNAAKSVLNSLSHSDRAAIGSALRDASIVPTSSVGLNCCVVPWITSVSSLSTPKKSRCFAYIKPVRRYALLIEINMPLTVAKLGRTAEYVSTSGSALVSSRQKLHSSKMQATSVRPLVVLKELARTMMQSPLRSRTSVAVMLAISWRSTGDVLLVLSSPASAQAPAGADHLPPSAADGTAAVDCKILSSKIKRGCTIIEG